MPSMPLRELLSLPTVMTSSPARPPEDLEHDIVGEGFHLQRIPVTSQTEMYKGGLERRCGEGDTPSCRKSQAADGSQIHGAGDGRALPSGAD